MANNWLGWVTGSRSTSCMLAIPDVLLMVSLDSLNKSTGEVMWILSHSWLRLSTTQGTSTTLNSSPGSGGAGTQISRASSSPFTTWQAPRDSLSRHLNLDMWKFRGLILTLTSPLRFYRPHRRSCQEVLFHQSFFLLVFPLSAPSTCTNRYANSVTKRVDTLLVQPRRSLLQPQKPPLHPQKPLRQSRKILWMIRQL